MVRTTSAGLRRSFAQVMKACSETTGPTRAKPNIFVAASALQSILLLGLALSYAFDTASLSAQLGQLFGVSAILSSGYVGYMVFIAGAVPAKPQISDTESPTANAPLPPPFRGASRHARSNADCLAELKERVSHELRTPLNAVIGFSDMMHSEMLGPVGNDRYREYAAHIRQSAEHFQRAAEHTLAVTELLASPPSRKRTAIHLGALLKQCLPAPTSPSGSLSPQWHLDVASGLHVEADRKKLVDALGHLWSAGRTLTSASDSVSSTIPTIHCSEPGDGHVELIFTIAGLDSDAGAVTEMAPGSELHLLLARLGIEAAGGSLRTEPHTFNHWRAIVTLPLVMQRELELH